VEGSLDVIFCALFIDVQAVNNTDITNVETYSVFFIIYLVFLIFIVTEINFNTENLESGTRQLKKRQVVKVA